MQFVAGRWYPGPSRYNSTYWQPAWLHSGQTVHPPRRRVGRGCITHARKGCAHPEGRGGLWRARADRQTFWKGGSLATVQCSTANPKTSLVVGETGSPLCELVQPDANDWPQSTPRPRPESSKRALSVLRTPQHTDVSETRHRAGGVLRTPRGSSLRWPEGRRSAKGTAPGATPQGDRLGSQKASIAAGSRLKFQPG